MKSGWSCKKMEEVVVSSDLGKTLNQSKDTGTLRPYLCAVNILWDKIDLSTVKETRFEDSEIDRYSVSKGDLLVCEGGDTGRSAIWESEESMLYQNALHRIRFNDEIYPRYALFFLRHLKDIGDIDQKYSKGVTIKHLVKSSLLSIPIKFPSFDVQKSIVSEFDLIKELIVKKKSQLADLDSLAQSLFYEMFGDPVENEMGWDVKKLGESVQEMFLGPFGSALKVDSYVPESESYAMVYEQKHAIQATLALENHFITKEKFKSLERFEVQGGDFIMSCRGTIGKLYRVPANSPRGIIHPSLMKIRIKEDVYAPVFFSFMLKKVVANQATKGNCVQMAITAKELGNKSLPIPPFSLQQQFAERIESIEIEKSRINTSLAGLETLLASRMQYYFD